MTILNNSAAIGIVAGGMTLVIITSGIDLSVGSVMGVLLLSQVMFVVFGVSHHGWQFTGLSIGLLVGAFQGVLVAYFGMPAFIATLQDCQYGEVQVIKYRRTSNS